MTFVAHKNELSAIIRAGEKHLELAGVDNPRLDASLLTAHALKLDRAQLLSQLDRALNDREKRRIEILIACRGRREPVARILGRREFWSLSFGINEATLVPRPESETLVEAVLRLTHPGESRDPENSSAGTGGTGIWAPAGACPVPRHGAGVESKLRILDLGTGSGCLLLSLLHELSKATGLGVDCAPRAVEQAKKNAEHLGLAARAEFRANNWADGIDGRFDIVVCNPPYIARGEIPALMPEVRDYDPRLALDGGADGLDVYRLLVPQMPGLLKPNGIAVFEIGIGQADAVPALFRQAGFASVQTRKDLGGIERCIIAAA